MVHHVNPHPLDDHLRHHRLASRHHYYQFLDHLDYRLVYPHHLIGRLDHRRLESLVPQMVCHHQYCQYPRHLISIHRPNLTNHFHQLVLHHHVFQAQDLG